MTYFDEIVSKYHCEFCKGFNAQHGLVTPNPSLKHDRKMDGVDNGGAFGTLMTDLSTAFDCSYHGH